MVKLTVVPVIPLALLDAIKTATFDISSIVMSRRPWVLLAGICCHCSQVIPDALARGSNALFIVPVSGRPVVAGRSRECRTVRARQIDLG
jgi:hypothetical protein